MPAKTYVMSLGGSLVAPSGGPDAKFLTRFKRVILKHIKAGDRFYLIVGGGKVCRHYIEALKDLGINDKDTHDYMGIFTTHFNAHYVSLAFGLDPHHKVVLKIENLPQDASLHITGAGLQPGQSSDAPSVKTALAIGSKTVINLSNISQVYTADPAVDDSAKPINQISWPDYLQIIPKTWTPGLSTPFDPVASNLAMDHDLTVAVLGPDIDNLDNYLNDKEFIGTVIKNNLEMING